MSAKITASFKSGDNEVTGVPVVNPGDWFGKAWHIEIPCSNAGGHDFIVEADSASDAIMEFSDSEYGHLIHVSDEDLGDYPEESRNYDDSGRVIDTKELLVHGMEGWDIKCPFPCLYHGEGIPAGGLTPLQFSQWGDMPDEVKKLICDLPGGLAYPERHGLLRTMTVAWETAFEAGNSAGWERSNKFHREEYGDAYRMLELIREIHNVIELPGVLKRAAWEFVRKARTFRDCQCRIERTPDGGFLFKRFGAGPTPEVWHSIESVPSNLAGGRVKFTFERMVEEWMEKEASR